MDVTKKSASQLKKEARQEAVKSNGGNSNNQNKRKFSSGQNEETLKKRRSSFNKTFQTSSSSIKASISENNSSALPPPKQKKKINKPKHLKRKLEQAQQLLAVNTEGAEQIAADLQKQQTEMEMQKKEAEDKFYQLCKTLVGEGNWSAQKQELYEKLKRGGCDKKKFLVTLGVDESKEKKNMKKRTSNFPHKGSSTTGSAKRQSGKAGKDRKKISRGKKKIVKQQMRGGVLSSSNSVSNKVPVISS